MSKMLTEICQEIKNYFTYKEDKHIGDFAIINGQISPSVNLITDYFAIFGSRKNNGVHKVSDNDLQDEPKFHGSIWIMSPPQAFLELVEEIEQWQAKNGAADSVAMSPFVSESFGGYAYSKGGGTYDSSGVTTWKNAYATRLKAYRRIRL